MVVGESKELFHVHKDIFCATSPFFKAALSHGFQEAEEQTISFPQDDVETFDRLTQWVYTQALSLPSMGEEEIEERYLALARLFVLAEKLQITVLRNSTVSLIYQTMVKSTWLPDFEVISYIYANTHRHCGLRRLLVASHVWDCDQDWFDSDECVHQLQDVGEFAAELAIGLAQRINHQQDFNPFTNLNDETAASLYYDDNHMEGIDDEFAGETQAEKK